jgi:hypothetical protein
MPLNGAEVQTQFHIGSASISDLIHQGLNEQRDCCGIWYALFQSGFQMRDKALREFDGILVGEVRPFRALEMGELFVILEMDTGRLRELQERVPDAFSGRSLAFELAHSPLWKGVVETRLCSPCLSRVGSNSPHCENGPLHLSSFLA